MRILGIDPGNSGAVAVYDEVLKNGLVSDCPVTVTMSKRKGKLKRRIESDVINMARLIQAPASLQKSGEKVVAIIEDVHSMPKQGVSSSFKFGKNYGIWLGLLAGCNIHFFIVTPQAWKKAIFGKTGTSKKESIELAKKIFPTFSDQLTRSKDDGRAEALLMITYYQRFIAPRQ